MGPLPLLRSSVLLCLLALVAMPVAAQAKPTPRLTKQPRIYQPKAQAGAQELTYRFGPVHVVPGQNTIDIEPNENRPKVPGYITSFKPDLIYADGTKLRKDAAGNLVKPRVDVIHLHHGVWIINGRPQFAAGEEKTTYNLPAGFGGKYSPQQPWLMNYMLHNLTPNPDSVYIQYTIGFIPDTAPEAKKIEPVTQRWMDVQPGIYPVFDALRKDADKYGEFTFPDGSADPYPAGQRRNEWTVDKDRTMIQTGGHLHPGGKETYLTLTRAGKTVRLFTSKAFYWEPAGAVSWDVGMTVTPANWRVAIKKGDVIGVHATYDVSRASWYESMGIMPFGMTDRPLGGKDPFAENTDVPGVLTHGHLEENRKHGGESLGLPDPQKVLNGPVAKGQLTIEGYVTSQGDLSAGDTKDGRLPTTPQGRGISFINLDATQDMKPLESAYHTITACKLPCNQEAGIAYPLADGPVDFDSGELGFGPDPTSKMTPTANRNTWTTPTGLKPGTYTYFCRVHPFMRGAFRVTPKQS